MKCTHCSFDNDADAEFCENCGKPLTRVCANCGATLRPTAKFCKKCGASVSELAFSASDLAPSPTQKEMEVRLAALRQAAPSTLRDRIRTASMQSEGERKPVTILFADIVGSTALARRLDPEQWREVVTGVHQRVSAIVYGYEGTIAQLLGDGVLAFFGAPITHEDDPIRALRAALDTQDEIRDYARKLSGFVDGLQMRIGVSTGTVVVGAVGSDMHMEYLAIGDSVNLAARLQTAAQPGQILISEATARLVRAAFTLNPLGALAVKGASEPVQAYEVMAPKSAPGSGRGIEGLTSPLVGRDAELTTLSQIVAGLRQGQGHIAFVLGEAGIGKSRLVEEAHRTAGLGLHWLEGRALSYGQTLSYWAITQIIKHDLDLCDCDTEATVKTALQQRCRGLFGDRAADVFPYLSHLLGLKVDAEAASRLALLDGETLKRQVIVSLAEYVSALAAIQPTILVFEDFHWADSSTIEALDPLLALTDRAPVALLLLTRIDRDHGSWRLKQRAETDYAHRYTEITLRPLTWADSNQLVDHLLSVTDLPDPIRRLMLDHAEGNPFYLEELIRSLIEQGVLVQEGQHWRTTRELADIEIPDTLQGVLLARIDRLQEDVRRTLQLAAVIGRNFLYRLLEAIAEAERSLDQHLAQLQRVDLVRERTRRPELEYMFKHALTQEAAYNSLLLERRRLFHHRVGDALETLFADRRDEFLGLLAHHFDMAGEFAKAVGYLIEAGDKARLEDAHAEAVRSYQRAVELLNIMGDDARASETWLKLGMVYHVNFEFEKAHQANEAAFALRQSLRTRAARQAEPQPARNWGLMRIAASDLDFATLDPGKLNLGNEAQVAGSLFAGLAELDVDLNLVPHAARSWQVLDGGARYLIYLRDDVRWSDGAAVTAGDFEWSWKRNLMPSGRAYPAKALDDIVGARDYREGRLHDADAIGVRALDALTLEVRLESPVAYFPYLLSMPVTYPIPRGVVERYGDEWWKPDHIVCNGPYRLVEFDPTHWVVYQRNPYYFGDFSGNVQRVEWHVLADAGERLRLFQQGWLDSSFVPPDMLPPELLRFERLVPKSLHTSFITLAPLPPLDDVRVRRALIHALDRKALAEGQKAELPQGGVLPRGMPGHSPEIGLPFDLELARRLLAEAGYPNGVGFPVLCGHAFITRRAEQIVQQWQEGLGIRVDLHHATGIDAIPVVTGQRVCHIYAHGWVADYPDPDNFLRQGSFYEFLRSQGWRDARYDDLVQRAARTPDRSARMAMYRQADRLLVAEQALVVPRDYGSHSQTRLLQPWVHHLRTSRTGRMRIQDVIIDLGAGGKHVDQS